MRRSFPPVLVVGCLAVLAASCSTSGGESDQSSDATTTAATETPTTVGESPETTEASPDSTAGAVETTAAPTTEAGPPADLVLGFDLSSGDINATREKYGVEGQNSNLLPEDYIVAMLDHYNEQGGIAGHTIVPVNYTAPTGDVAAEVKDQERCETYFGGDLVADAVIGTNSAVLNQCATDAERIVFGRGFTGLNAAELESYPGLVNAQAATYDRVAKAAVQLAVDQGALAEGDVAAVVYPGCENTTEVFEAALAPAIEAAGATVSAFEGTCIRSQADEGAAIAELPNAVLQFKADGASVVFNLATGFIPVALLMTEAQNQGVSPTWVLTSNNEFGALSTMNPPAEQLANTIGAGWTAALDTFELDPTKLGPAAPDCLATFAEIGFPAPANLGELASQLDVCSMFTTLELMLADSPGAIDRDTMLATLAGSGVDNAALTISVDWSSGRQPNAAYRPAAWDAATGRFAYTGDVMPMPD
ncbi:MAG: hypothetical protein R2743_03790 [Ilumatobacteraceae bacterium]